MLARDEHTNTRGKHRELKAFFRSFNPYFFVKRLFGFLDVLQHALIVAKHDGTLNKVSEAVILQVAEHALEKREDSLCRC